ncbi:clathrin associated protein complex medium subunit [Savitreella phatthalungensis]
MISAIFVHNLKGDVVIARMYRHDLKRSVADAFRIQVVTNPDASLPVLTIGSTTFLHIRHDNLFFVAVTRINADVALVFEMLNRLVALTTGFLGKCDEEAVKNNLVLIYELLDELVDFGYPQTCDMDHLRARITSQGVKIEKRTKAKERPVSTDASARGDTPWRGKNIKYRKNETFVDVVEEIDALVGADGTPLRASVAGAVQVRAYLSGSPECRLGLNDRLVWSEQLGIKRRPDRSASPDIDDRVEADDASPTGVITLEDCQFHQCVSLERFGTDRTISFVPPDGEFELMRYRVQDSITLPFRLHPIVNELSSTKIEIRIAVKANFEANLSATDVVLSIPTPGNAANVNLVSSQGKAKWQPACNAIEWSINKFPGGAEYVLSAEADLAVMVTAGSKGSKAWAKPPIAMRFKLIMFTASGLVVRYLRISEPHLGYAAVKWVRYLTRNGSYEVRT